MASFFDLSIPYLERDGAPAADTKARKDARLRSVVRAMELGYTAVAYDRPHRGVISDADRCKIPPFPLSSLLRAAPVLASSASFRRGLLGVPLSSPFHQYSRLTVALDSAAAAAALNSSNSMLRTYDLVAARPLNQMALDHACKVSEVDIIAIDFSQKLPFRLKRPLVEAATKRGLHFEITYSHLIVDVNIRRQMLSDAKLLVHWTRGKNLIISSAASTVNEIRGPYDVANLSAFLLGLPMERAKAALSKNCRSLIANTLRKKHCYKEAIRIERILPNKQPNPEKAWFGDWNNWDPISSGEGDLPPLDDITKFSAASEVPKSSIVTAFMSVIDGTRSTSQISGEDNMLSQSHRTSPYSFSGETGVLAVHHETPSSNDVRQHDRLVKLLAEERISTNVAPIEQHTSGNEGYLISPSNRETAKEHAPPIAHDEDSKIANMYIAVSDADGMPSDDITLKNCIVVSEDNLILPDANLTDRPVVESIVPSNMFMEVHTSLDGAGGVSAVIVTPKDASTFVDYIPSVAGDQTLLNDNLASFIISEGMDIPEEQIMSRPDDKENNIQVSSFDPTTMQKDFVKSTPNEQGEDARPLFNDMLLDDPFDEIIDQDEQGIVQIRTSSPLHKCVIRIEDGDQNDCAAANGTKTHKNKSGKERRKERTIFPAYPLSLKGLLKPTLFKRKAWRLRRHSKHLSQTGYVHLRASATISWRSYRQSLVSTSLKVAKRQVMYGTSKEYAKLKTLVKFVESNCERT